MLSKVFSLTRLRRKSFLYGIFFLGVVAIYTVFALKVWSGDASISPDTNINSWKKVLFEQRIIPGYFIENSTAHFNYFPQTWKPEYKGQANLHVFEDWCGSSTAQLRKNLHYPLYPHTRTTVQKLAVAPQWTNYGLRIFGYLHPYVEGEFVFALSSHDNSEFWLSTDYSPHNLRLLAWIGMSGAEWAAPGEYGKYSSQTSKPIRLSAEKRYFFEVIHKQDNKGTDHIGVAWKLQNQGLGFMTIGSEHISLYVNESALLMGDVTHIPQTVASHEQTLVKDHNAAVDMLIEDPRDTFYQVPLIDSKFLQGLLPDCLYRPSYTIKGSHLQRYQGLTFVHFSFIYPNDYTRLTHMESENSCFYPESTAQRETFGFSKYMKLDHFQKESAGRDLKFHKKDYENNKFDNEVRKGEKQAMQDHVDNALFPDYGDDEDDYAHNRRRKLFSYHETDNTIDPSDTRLHVDKFQRMQRNDAVIQLQPDKPDKSLPLKHLLQQNQTEARNQIKQEGRGPIRKQNVKSVKTGNTIPKIPRGKNLIKAKEESGVPLELLMLKHSHIHRSGKMNKTEIQRHKDTKLQLLERDNTLAQQSAKWQRIITREVDVQLTADKPFTSPKRAINHLSVGSYQRDMDSRADIMEKKIEVNMPLRQDFENSVNKDNKIRRDKKDSDWWGINGQEDQAGWEDKVYNRAENIRIVKRNFIWGAGEDSEDVQANAPVFNSDINWGQTFQVNPLDLQAQRSDAIDLECKISGNLVLPSNDALPIVKAFMDKLEEKHQGLFTLERVINVVKRVDKDKGNRYLLELELKDMNGKLLRLSHFIYTMIHQSKQPSGNLESQQPKPELVLCNPVGFQWNPAATVHFIVPVKNQARWVKQLIVDMEKLYRETGDNNFNLIITDYSSTDMNVKKALQESLLPSYQYVKLIGNFQRSAGLQAGIDLIEDQHSIVFLCDLHIRFPSSIIDTIRKSCVEGHMVFAPVVMRLDCGATILDARGFWEVHGFGLIGIYKSDLDVVGGMNTKEYKDHWGGEDWELLDRILEAGLEVERIYLRNFFHHFHSKRGMWEQQKES